jgi:Leucine-rich repeat (LRR) protein
MLYLLKKIRFRFSVRTLFVATTVLGVLLGLAGNEANRLRLHRQALRKVDELGGWHGSVIGDKYGARRGPSWCPVIHDSLYADFEYVWFNRTTNAGLRDEDLAIIKYLPRLRDLQMAAPLVTDEALVHVEGIKSLRELTLYQTQITNRGLRLLSGIPLEKLVLAGPHVTDETLEALEAFPALRKLMISESSVTGLGLEHLEHVPNLEKLFLTDNPLCNSGMSHLASLTHLYELDLRNIAITDDEITPLTALKRLRFLNVAQTRVTEAGLLAFHNSPTLKYLYIGEQSSSDSLKALTIALPGCQVYDSSGIRCMQGW